MDVHIRVNVIIVTRIKKIVSDLILITRTPHNTGCLAKDVFAINVEKIHVVVYVCVIIAIPDIVEDCAFQDYMLWI